MKATYFRATRTANSSRINSVEYRVTFDENEEYKSGSQFFYVFELDENYLPTKVLVNDIVQKGALRLWQNSLLSTVKKDLRDLDRSDADVKEWTYIESEKETYPTYRFESLPDGVRWILETDTSEDCFTSAWNSFTKAFDSISKTAVSFFSAAPVQPYCFHPQGSNFKPEQITKIEALINELNKEIKSVWYPNEKLKITKRDGLINMLERSKKGGEIWQIISETMAIPGMIEGCRSRTHELLKDLQEGNKSPKIIC